MAKTDWVAGNEVTATDLNSLGTEVNSKAAGNHTHEGGGTSNPLLMLGNLVTLIYDETSARWEFADGTAPTLTGRTASIMWEGTAAQIPAQGTGDADFRVGDKATVRSTGYAA